MSSHPTNINTPTINVPNNKSKKPTKTKSKKPTVTTNILPTKPTSQPTRKSTRNKNKPARYRVNQVTTRKKKKNHSFDNPTLEQAKKRADWPKWEEAIKEELQQMQDEKVYQLIQKKDLKSHHNVIHSMYVLQIKRDKVTGAIDKYKARLVALGNKQKENSYKDVKSNTVKSNTVKLLLSIQAHTNAHAMVLDVKGAYLKSKINKRLKEHLVICLPNGQYAILDKYLYGLKQSGLQWQNNITNFLLKNDFTPTSDPLLFQKKFQNEDFLITSIHVDDFYCISNKRTHLDDFYNIMLQKYDNITVKHGNNLQYLGLSIVKNSSDNTIHVSQPAYIEKILQECNMDLKSPCSTPMSSTADISEHNDKSDSKSNDPVDKLEYMRLVGMINYLAIYTRPDLLYSLSIVSQASNNPTQRDLLRVKRIFRYILQTKDKHLIFTQSTTMDVLCYVDASHNSYKNGRAHYGFAFMFGEGNAVFCVKSTKLKIVTLSSTESEYMALAFALREGIFIVRLLKELGFYNNKPIKFFQDNQPVIDMLTADQLNHETTKHINPKFHFTKEYLKKGIIDIIKIDTTLNIADIFTKALAKRQFKFLSEQLLNHYN